MFMCMCICAFVYVFRRRFPVFGDNDPISFKSKAAVQANEDSNLDVFEIPKHSQLNVLEYYLRSALNKRMRATERKYPVSKKEKRSALLWRLTRTAKSLPHREGREARRALD